MRDLTIHGDDLIIATHGRSFWILDDISPLRHIDAAVQSASAWLYKPATAVRVDNDLFLGTPLPPEEPTAKNPPNGAVVDYYLRSAAQKVMLEIFDGDNKVIRRYISGATPAKRPPLPIAPRWLPNPPALEITPGMHRFVWDLRWSSSGASGEVEDEGFGAPPGPRVVPGTYQVKLTVDGKSFTQPLKIVMDPRSSATSKVLAEQLQLGLEIFAEARKGRQTAAEIASLKKRLDDLKSQVVGKPALLSQLEAIETAITTIDAGTKIPSVEPWGWRRRTLDLAQLCGLLRVEIEAHRARQSRCSNNRIKPSPRAPRSGGS